MKKTIQTIILILSANGLLAQTNISAGNVSGTWTKTGSPYKVNGNITIPNGNTLTIEPGVRVEFAFKTYLKVDGRIIAKGGKNSSDSIWFTKQMTHDTGSWKGVKFINTSNTNDSSEFKYCVFRHCKSLWDTLRANLSGGITVLGYGKVKINNSSFYRNEATTGASIYITNFGFAKITSCEFKQNKVSVFPYTSIYGPNSFHKPKGSAIAVDHGSNSIIDSCVFKNNIRGKDYGSNPSILNEASTLDVEGSQFYNLNSYATIKNSIFDNNEGYCIYIYNKGIANFNQCEFKNAPNGKSGNVLYSSSNSLLYVENSILKDNWAKFTFETSNSKIYFKNCLLYKNHNTLSMSSGNSYSSMENCKILNNHGGRSVVDNSLNGQFSASKITNSLIANNEMDVYMNGLQIDNCTVVNNRSSKRGFISGLSTMKNTIVWGNVTDSFPNKQMYNLYNNASYFYNNLLQGDTSIFAWSRFGYLFSKPTLVSNTVSGNPQFVNPTLGAGATFDALNADFSLKSTCAITSPAINAGSTDTLYMRLPKTDLGTNQRFYEGRIDIGCYEDNSGSAKITINKQPKNDTLCENTRAALLTYTAFGKGKTTQWQLSTNGNTWTNYSTNDSLKINNPLANNNTYQYRAIINGTCDKDTTNIVTVFAKPSPVVNLGKDTAICQGSNLNIISNATGTHLWHNNSTNNNNNQTINNNQTWWLQVTATNGCKSRDSLNITSKTKPTVNLGPDKSLHQLGSLQLDAGASQKSYLWNDNSTGQTRTFFGKDLGANGTYTLWVKVTGNNDCVASDSINITVFNNTSISQTNKEITRVYPNPSKDKLTIETKENSRIVIYDAQGKEILNQQNESNKQEIMISHLPQGIYTLQIITPNSEIETIKLIIEQ